MDWRVATVGGLSWALLALRRRRRGARACTSGEGEQVGLSLPMYFDFNATTPVAACVAAAMQPYLHTVFGNPSSSHKYGRAAKQGLDRARAQVAACLHAATPRDVVFTSGATESINWAIRGAAEAMRERHPERNHIITSVIEHPVVHKVCEYLEKHGYTVTKLPVNSSGRVRVRDLAAALSPRTCLVTVMLANNETGAVQPVAELCQAARDYDPAIMFHTDASQAVGKIHVDVSELNVDLLTVAGHKIYAPKGVGCLYLRPGRLPLIPLLHGPSQEFGKRAGTENVLLAVGLGEACALVTEHGAATRQHMLGCRDRLEAAILQGLERALPSGGSSHALVHAVDDGGPRLPNTLSISFRGLRSDQLLGDEVLKANVAASAGAACHSGGAVTLSPVIKAMRVPSLYAVGTVRLSVGMYTSFQQVDACAQFFVQAVLRQQQQADAAGQKVNSSK